MFVNTIHFHRSLIFAGKAAAYFQSMELNSNGRILTLPTNIKLEQKWMGVSNTLAYYDMAVIIAVLS